MKGFIEVVVKSAIGNVYSRSINIGFIQSFYGFINDKGEECGKIIVDDGNEFACYTTQETYKELVAKVEEATGNKKLDEMLEEVKKMAKKWQNWEL